MIIKSRFSTALAIPATALALLVGIGLASCGGGGGGSSAPPPPSTSITVQPTSVVLGQSALLTWTASSGTSCTASGGWSGSEAASGTQTVTPGAVGTITYTLTCSGGAYTGSTAQGVMLAVTAPSAFSATSLVADGSGALTTDAHLVNAWGIAFGPTSPVWVANNGTASSTLYDGNGRPQPFSAPRVVALPLGAGGADFDGTGIVFNSSTGFVVSSGGKSAAAAFIFDGEGGMIAGWSPSVDAANAVTMYTDAGGAIYKGLAIANNGSANFLYATDFHNAKIDVFDSTFTKQTPTATSFAFADPTLPAGYAPFGIQAIKNGPGGTTQIYVSYALPDGPDKVDNQNGAGLGLVNVFDANGNLVKHLVTTGGLLNAPWGLALAPSDFGTLSGALLVGNFGDGRINGFDAATGAYIGTVTSAAGAAFAVPGLWGIAFGNDAANQPHNTLFYAAGPNNEANGAYGRIDLGATPPVLNTPPVVTLVAPTGTLAGTVSLSATVQNPVGIAKVEFFANGTTSLGVTTASPYTVSWNTTLVADGSVTLTAVATDIDANVGSSAALSVTVTNTAPAATTLTQLQAQVFTPICSGCHSGAGSALPGVQNLSNGNSFAALVGVASLEQPGVLRVKPGDPDNSYLIQKLEGAAGIAGARMPFGGPYLDQPTIAKIRAWIAAGAANN